MAENKKPSTSVPIKPGKVIVKKSQQTDSRPDVYSKDSRTGGIDKPKH